MNEELNERELNETELNNAAGGAGALLRYYFKCINPNCIQFNHKVAVMLPRLDVKVKCKQCNQVMVLQP